MTQETMRAVVEELRRRGIEVTLEYIPVTSRWNEAHAMPTSGTPMRPFKATRTIRNRTISLYTPLNRPSQAIRPTSKRSPTLSPTTRTCWKRI